MQSVVKWAGESGFKIEPHGLNLIPLLAELARRRLPAWTANIHVGNVLQWTPPRPYDFVRTELEYAPPERRGEMIERILRGFVAPGGRLIVCSYKSAHRPEAEPVEEVLRGFGYEAAGEAGAADTNGVVLTRLAWVKEPAR